MEFSLALPMEFIIALRFGKENFRNEIVINRSKYTKEAGKRFLTKTDSVFFYTKTNNYNFYSIKRERETTEWLPFLHLPGGQKTTPEREVFGKKFYPPKGRHWAFSQIKLDMAIYEEYVRLRCNNCGYIHFEGVWTRCPKCDKDEPIPEIFNPFQPVTSNWTDIPGYTARPKGYPTENSEQLLERIIKASSNEGEIVLDAFAGSGTTGAVAEKLKRRWIMIDSSKFAIYTMVKKLLNLREKIGNKGRNLKPKSFALYNAGLYDMKMLKELPFIEYRKFALELFQCRDEIHTLAGIELDGHFGYDHVLVFKWKKNAKIRAEYVMDRGFIDNIHSILKDKVGKKFFIIAPAASVVFLEDYIEKDGIKYYVLRIPYSVIDELHKKNFKLLEQPISGDISEVNKVMEQIGFDFIYPPDVECKCYIDNPENKLFKEAVIKIKKFRSNIISKKPIPEEELGIEALSMIMIDYDFNGDYFNMDDKWFASDLEKNNYEIRFPVERIKNQIMVIYIDVYGNEKKEILTVKKFKNEK